MNERPTDTPDNFEDLVWLFTCDSRSRGRIRQGFDEAALLWKAVKATSGNLLEIGRNFGGSTVLLAVASPGRALYSIDLAPKHDHNCEQYFARAENNARLHLLVADSRQTLPGLTFGFAFIDGDHTLAGVLADVVAHWNSLRASGDAPALVAFHDALPNRNFVWRDEGRRYHRFWTRLKNKFRREKKPEIAQDYSVGVFRVCEKLEAAGCAERWGAASSMLVLKKLRDLPPDFARDF